MPQTTLPDMPLHREQEDPSDDPVPVGLHPDESSQICLQEHEVKISEAQAQCKASQPVHAQGLSHAGKCPKPARTASAKPESKSATKRKVAKGVQEVVFMPSSQNVVADAEADAQDNEAGRSSQALQAAMHPPGMHQYRKPASSAANCGLKQSTGLTVDWGAPGPHDVHCRSEPYGPVDTPICSVGRRGTSEQQWQQERWPNLKPGCKKVSQRARQRPDKAAAEPDGCTGDGDGPLGPEPGGFVSAAWHARTEGTSQATRSPLRMILAACLFKELEDRSSKVVSHNFTGHKLRQELIKKQIISEYGAQLNQLQWNQEKEQLLATEGARQTLQQAQAAVGELRQLCQKPGLIVSFHALKSLTKVLARDGQQIIPWKMVIGHREPDARRMYTLMQGLTHCGITQLLLMRVRPANMKRSPPAQKIGQMLEGNEVMGWKLHNQYQCCYMNSSIWAHLWSATFLADPDTAWGAMVGLTEEAAQSPDRSIFIPSCSTLKGWMSLWFQT